MTSSFSPNKNLEEPASGDYPNAWATPVNANWTAIDTSLGGVTTINVTGISTNQVFTVNQYRPPNIIFIGTLSSNIDYFFPAGVGGIWSIANNTTGAFEIGIVSLGGGLSLALSPQRTLIVCDGTNVTLADPAAVQSAVNISEAFATAADAVVLSTAETFATNAANTAQSNAQAFATAADAVVLNTAETFTTTSVAAVAPKSGTFTCTLSGMTAATTGTVHYEISGKGCILTVLAAITGTSNSTSMTMTGLPGAVIPATGTPTVICSIISSSANQLLGCALVNGSAITFGLAAIQSPVTNGTIASGATTAAVFNTGTKGLPAGWTITYSLD